MKVMEKQLSANLNLVFLMPDPGYTSMNLCNRILSIWVILHTKLRNLNFTTENTTPNIKNDGILYNSKTCYTGKRDIQMGNRSRRTK